MNKHWLFMGMVILWTTMGEGGTTVWAGSLASSAGRVVCLSQPRHDITLSLAVAGDIAKILVQEGQSVGKGDLLLQLDDRQELLEYQRRELLANSPVEVNAAKNREANTLKLMERAKNLARTTGSVSQEDVDKATTDYQLANAERLRLENEKKLQALDAGRAKLDLEKRKLLSPMEGAVVRLFLDEGATALANQPLVRLVDTRIGVLTCSIEHKSSQGLTKGKEVTIHFPTLGETMQKNGVVVFASPLQDAASSLREIKIEFDNKDGIILLGSSGELELPMPTKLDHK
ncbi:MAG: efflux RND transporter periplasmic adaptor subunit [Magnetococcales bacterium]|nr:efflux RND transporter periplasmic adaptor subunit [Magnetococcales bacterium]